MPRIQKINHKGKEIFHMDFSNINNVQEIRDMMIESAMYIRSQPRESVITLTNISGMHFSSEIKDLFGEFIKGNKPYVKAGAVIGVSGLQQILYNGLMKVTGRDIRSFSNDGVAKDWLVDAN